MGAGAYIALLILMVLVAVGIATIIGLWLREGSVFPGDRTERIHREILDEIDTRLKKFDAAVAEAKKIEVRLLETADRAARIAGIASALSISPETSESNPVRDVAKPPLSSNDPTLTKLQRERLKKIDGSVETASAVGSLADSGDGPSAEYGEKALRALELTRQGKSNAEIASSLGLGVGEVELIISLAKDAAGL